MEKYTDEALEDKLKDYIMEQMKGTGLDIKVQSHNGEVILSGIVDVLSEKNSAEQLVKRFKGIKSVENCITVSTDGTFSDKETEYEVINKFKEDESLSSLGVNVVRGIAIIDGRVDNLKSKKLAMSKAAEAFGVKDIVSHIEITSAHKIDDVTLNNRVQQTLVYGNLDNQHIDVSIENGSVSLNGIVNSSREMEMAEEIISHIEGVRYIRNNLKTKDK